MARPLRLTAPGVTQHVVMRGVNKSVVFVDATDYRFFSDALAEACVTYDCEVHAYVLMTNHVHLLVTAGEAGGIARAMQAVGRRYVRRFNDTYGRTGHLWEGRYKAAAVQAERYLFTCFRYVELNPVRAGLTPLARDYPWSSHRANAFGIRDVLVSPHERYTALGADSNARQAAYRALFDEALDEATLAEIRESASRGRALGNQRFRDEIAAHYGRKTQPGTRGRRPRKNDEIRV